LHEKDKYYFGLLKEHIVGKMKKSYPGISNDISEWKGQEITDFQEELLQKVNAQISEKWFYNHAKSENKTLPRIDVLNILSRYVGFANWDDFVFKNRTKISGGRPVSKGNRIFIILPLFVLLIMAALFVVFKFLNSREYHFSFYDVHTQEVISGNRIQVTQLSDKESPKSFLSDSAGVVVLKTDESFLKLIITAPYYRTDTINRILKKFETYQKIGLQANDYALIIHYFSEMNVDDWQKRRDYLGQIIDNRAIIYQVHNNDNSPGMALYNKTEFIDKLTMPSSSLKNIEILDTKFKDDKIMVLRFRINKQN